MRLHCAKCHTPIEAEPGDSPLVVRCQSCSASLLIPGRKSEQSAEVRDWDEVKESLKSELLKEIQAGSESPDFSAVKERLRSELLQELSHFSTETGTLERLREEFDRRLSALEARLSYLPEGPPDMEALVSELRSRLSASEPSPPVTVPREFIPVDPQETLSKIEDEKERDYIHSKLPDKKLYLLTRSDTKVDTGGWVDRNLWVMLTDDSLVLCAGGKKEYAEEVPLSELSASLWNDFTGEFVLSPAENSRVKKIKLKKEEAETILTALGRT